MDPESASRLPPDTAEAWDAILDLVPAGAYLAGGTAVALQLGHRESRDLNWFCAALVDVVTLDRHLGEGGSWVASEVVDTDERFTLNGLYSRTKLQFLDARGLHPTEPVVERAGADLAGLGDLQAMKLQVLADRGELRDYHDVYSIETRAARPIEEGLGIMLDVYRPRGPDALLRRVVLAMGHFDDVADDPGVPMARSDLETWFASRVPQVVRTLGVF